MNKPGKTRQIHPAVMLFLFLLGAGLFVSLVNTIGWVSTGGFYGLLLILVVIMIARAPKTGNQED